MAAGRARTAEERKRLKEMAEELKEEAWQEGGALSSLPEEGRTELEEVARQTSLSWVLDEEGLLNRMAVSPYAIRSQEARDHGPLPAILRPATEPRHPSAVECPRPQGYPRR